MRVAAVASDLPLLLPPVGDQGFDVRYSDRLAVELDVAQDEPLESVYARAIDHFKPRPDPSAPGHRGTKIDSVAFAWFYEPADEAGLEDTGKPWEWVEDLITVDQSGSARWNRTAAEIPYADLVRAGELGLLRGDPLRPYLMLLLPQGDVDITTAWEITKRAWEILGHLALAREVGRLALDEVKRRRMAKAVEDGVKTIDRHAGEWAVRRAGPSQILKTLERRPWTLDDLRMVLRLDNNEEAAELLALYGFVADERGVYEVSADWELVLHAVASDAAYTTVVPTLSHEGHAKRLRYLLETGELPDPWADVTIDDEA